MLARFASDLMGSAMLLGIMATERLTIARARFSTWTETVVSESKMVAGVPPVARWYQVKASCMNPMRTIPMLHWKSWVHDMTIGGSRTAVKPSIAWDWK